MSNLLRIWNWLLKVIKRLKRPPLAELLDKDKYSFVYVEEIPENIPENTVFILNEGVVDEAAFFICPCGCQQCIELNLLKDSSPRWEYSTKEESISIFPSVWRKIGCKSHFFVRSGKIVWAYD